MQRSEIRKIATAIKDTRREWHGYNEAQAGIDSVIVALARALSKNTTNFSVARWVELCGTALTMGFLAASIERERAVTKRNKS